MMELYLQFGHGMMGHCKALVTAWKGGTVVLSPRDLNAEQLERLSRDVNKIKGGAVLLDPQFYLPHADHERLCSHEYWPGAYDTGTFWAGSGISDLLTRLKSLNAILFTSAFILPGMMASTIDDDWLNSQKCIINAANSLSINRPLLATVALGADAARDESQIALLMEHAPRWKVAGCYLVCEHPNGEYLVDDPSWLANVLDVVAGLRLAGLRVVIGYCNHQMLAVGCCKANAICSGTWMNVRSFPPEKFSVPAEEEQRRKATWYYCPQALSEYKVPFLDIAHRQGILSQMKPPAALDGGYVSPLFSGSQPSTVGLLEPDAFRHYLNCLRKQSATSIGPDFDSTIAAHEAQLTKVEGFLATLSKAGVRAQQRAFDDIVDVNRAALAVLKATRGPMLRRKWSNL